MSDNKNTPQDERLDALLTEKLEEIKNLLDTAATTYSGNTNNSFLKTQPFQELIIDRFLSLDNVLQNTDRWSKDEILEMAALFMLMTIDAEMEDEDNNDSDIVDSDDEGDDE